MAKTIAIIGATGSQGGSVARRLLEDKNWTIRAITRNINGDAAKALASAGAEVVAANFDDEKSLSKAFKDVHAIFAVTNFWEHLFSKSITAEECAKLEYIQSCTLANAAAKIPTLEHYVWSSLPNTNAISHGRVKVWHMDSKAATDDYIRQNLPELATKTTFLWVGYYPSNLAYFPMLKPVAMPAPGPYIFLESTPSTMILPSAGDVTENLGHYVSAILTQPQLTLPGKYVMVQTDSLSSAEMLKLWTKVTGKTVEHVQIPAEAYARIWGPAGAELNLNSGFLNDFPDPDAWGQGKVLSAHDLDIADKLVNTERTLESLKNQLIT